jgi:hypothetical protein
MAKSIAWITWGQRYEQGNRLKAFSFTIVKPSLFQIQWVELETWWSILVVKLWVFQFNPID